MSKRFLFAVAVLLSGVCRADCIQEDAHTMEYHTESELKVLYCVNKLAAKASQVLAEGAAASPSRITRLGPGLYSIDDERARQAAYEAEAACLKHNAEMAFLVLRQKYGKIFLCDPKFDK